MKVWIVIEYRGYEDVYIMGVFHRSAVAHQFMKEQKAKKEHFVSYNVEKWEVKSGQKEIT
jgi:hypothetical protein